MTATIARPRIMARLDVAADCPVILVEAPAGYGKSVAVRQWVATRRGDGRAVWIDLPTVATRPARFVSALLREAGTAIEGSSTREPACDDAALEEALDDGLAALSRAAGAVTIVLDRVDDADAAIMALIRRVVDGLPPSWRLVLTSRTTPAVGVARLRAALAIATVDATDLRFDTTETAALLRGSLGLGVDDATVSDLTRPTPWRRSARSRGGTRGSTTTCRPRCSRPCQRTWARSSCRPPHCPGCHPSCATR
jgi:LuxR family maltose regulon positive regulatory protein